MDQLALPFAFAVPASTSLKLTGNNVPPGTGPYMWKSCNLNTEAVLVRNPYFKVWGTDGAACGRPERDRREVRSAGLRCGHRGRERHSPTRSLMATQSRPTSSTVAERPAVRRPGARQHADRRLLHGTEHLGGRRSTTCRPGRPSTTPRTAPAYVKILRRSVARGACLPDPAAQLPLPTSPYCPYTTGSPTVCAGPNLAKAKAAGEGVRDGRRQRWS